MCSALFRKCDPTVPCPANFSRTQDAAQPNCIVKTCQVAAGRPRRGEEGTRSQGDATVSGRDHLGTQWPGDAPDARSCGGVISGT